MLEAETRFVSFSNHSLSSSGVILPISPGYPGLVVILKAFLWTSSRGKVATIMLLLLCYFYIIIYIQVYIHIFFFYSYQVFTWAILAGYSALFQCACNLPEGSCVGPEAAASGPGT